MDRIVSTPSTQTMNKTTSSPRGNGRGPDEPPRDTAGPRNRALAGATLGFFVGFAPVALFGPTAKLLDQNMMMTSLQLGVLVAAPNLSGSLLRIPFGAWVDTTGGRTPFAMLLGLSALGMVGLSLLLGALGPENLTMAHYPLLLVFALLSGCGIATFSVGIGQVSYWFPKRAQGWALGAYAGFGNLAPGLFSYLIPLLIGAIAITGTYLVWLAFALAGLAVYLLSASNAPYFQLRQEGYGASEAQSLAAAQGQELFPQGGVWDGLARAARIPETWSLVFLYFTTFGGFLALTAWFPTYWQDSLGYSLAVAGALTMTYSVLASLVRVPGGILADRLGGVRTVALSMGVMLVGALLLTFAGTLGIAIAGLLAIAVGMGTSNAGVFKLVPQYVGSAVGGASGWVGGLGALGGFVIPPILGYVVEVRGAAGYAEGFIVFVVLAGVSLLLTYRLARQARSG